MEELALTPDTLDGHCLPEDVIHALASGGLEAAERSKALAHLDECELCQALLADEVRGLPEFSSSDDAVTRLIQVGALVGGRYRVKRFLARGGMGEVYEAWDSLLSERVALKTITPLAASVNQARATARFKQEVQLSRRVADAHVCRIYEFGHHLLPGFGPLAYLTMEFIEGQTLGARLRKGPRLELDEVVELSRQVLRGLSAAHTVGVLHRDLKSENVMLRADPRNPDGLHAVIMDFGLARVLGDQAHLLTERYEFVGSAAYMAPEQLEEGSTLTQATDIYAFGVVLFEMLTGRLPFEGKSAVAMAMRRLSQQAPAPSHFVPELSEAWDELVLGCLERSVSQRFASTQEVSAALEAIVHSSSVMPTRRQRRQRALLATTALATLGGAVIVFALAHTRPNEVAQPSAEQQNVIRTLHPEPRAETAPTAATPPSPSVPAALGPPGAVSPAAVSPAAVSPAALPPVAVQTEVRTEKPAATAIDPAIAAVPPRRSGERRSPTPSPKSSASSASTAPPAASPAAPPAPAEDVRDLFFLEGPSDRPRQNSKE